MKITIHGTAADIDALLFLRLKTFNGSDLGQLVLIVDLGSIRVRKDPYSDDYRLCLDVVALREEI
jgi:hypothetical protein